MRRKNIHAQMTEELGRKISTGILAPGSRVPPEPELASTLGVSRIVVREAVKSLVAKGMISVRPRIGTHVESRSEWNLLDREVLEWHFSAEPDERLLDDLIELRRILEPAAAKLASARATAADLGALRAALTFMRQASAGGDPFLQADLRFHDAVLHACHNQFISQMRAAFSQVLRISIGASTGEIVSGDAIRRHERVVQAIECRDGRAAVRATERLIDLAAERIRTERLGRRLTRPSPPKR